MFAYQVGLSNRAIEYVVLDNGYDSEVPGSSNILFITKIGRDLACLNSVPDNRGNFAPKVP